MEQASVFGKVSSNVRLPDIPTEGAGALTLEIAEFPEKNTYDTPVKIR